MMHLLRKYDVAPVGRNDAMFAPMCRQAHIIRRRRHHWRSQHHLPKANIIEKSSFFRTSFFLVRATGLEPAHRRYKILNLTRLPISPCPLDVILCHRKYGHGGSSPPHPYLKHLILPRFCPLVNIFSEIQRSPPMVLSKVFSHFFENQPESYLQKQPAML